MLKFLDHKHNQQNSRPSLKFKPAMVYGHTQESLPEMINGHTLFYSSHQHKLPSIRPQVSPKHPPSVQEVHCILSSLSAFQNNTNSNQHSLIKDQQVWQKNQSISVELKVSLLPFLTDINTTTLLEPFIKIQPNKKNKVENQSSIQNGIKVQTSIVKIVPTSVTPNSTLSFI